MKVLKTFFIISTFLLAAFAANAQKVTSSQPLKKDDYRHTEFEIIGKLKAGTPAKDKYASHVLIYKNNDGEHHISVYSPEMEFIGNVDLRFLTNQLLGVDFISFPDHFIMFYQYQEGSYVYCKALLLDGNGQVLKHPELIDSSEVGRKQVKSRIYSIVHSDDRKKMLVYKINQDNENDNIFYTFTYDNRLNFLRNSRLTLSMKDRRAFLAGFHLSNEGLFYFLRASRHSKNSNITKADLITKPLSSDSFYVHPLPLKNISLGKIKLKLDRKRKKIYTAAFYSHGRRGTVEGLYVGSFSLNRKTFTNTKTRAFKESLLQDASQKKNNKNAFNDYYIRDLIVQGGGGFLVTAEKYYSSESMNNWNGLSPYYSPWGISPYYPSYGSMYYSPFSPYYYNPYGFRQRRDNEYNYQDIAILSYDSTLSLTWSNFIQKQQESEGSVSFLSYKMMNLSSALLFIYNDPYRRSFLLTVMSVTPNGKLSKLPTLRGQDRGLQWMPRYGRQISARSVVIPCIYKNYLSFAKITF